MEILLFLLTGFVFLQLTWALTDPRPIGVRLREEFSVRTAIFYLIVLGVLLPAVVNFLFFPLPPTRFDQILIVFGLVIFIIGGVLAVWAKLTMGKSWHHAIKLHSKQEDKMITTGPFAFSRNPIYLGFLLMAFGFNFTLRSFFIFLVLVLFIILRLVIQKEEKILEDHFGKDYLDYKKRVPRFLLL